MLHFHGSRIPLAYDITALIQILILIFLGFKALRAEHEHILSIYMKEVGAFPHIAKILIPSFDFT